MATSPWHMVTPYLHLSLLLCGLLLNTSAQKTKRSEFIQTLLADYDNRVPPNFDDEPRTPLEVDIQMYIISFDSINESTMDYKLTVYLRQQWRDHRLQYGSQSNDTSIMLDGRLLHKIWVPDLYFSNEKQSHFHDVTVPNKAVWIKPDGTLTYSSRVSLRLACPMQLHKFPLDTQVCLARMESYAYLLDVLKFKWAEDPIQLNEDLELPQFHLVKSLTKDCTKNYTTGSFSCLELFFELKRDIGFFMIQLYVPSALIVILSWVSFWISADAIPARISLGVLTILTMTTQSSGSSRNLPRVSYVKAVDVWMAVCLLFVFAALLEFAVVNVLSRREIKKVVKRRSNGTALKKDNDIQMKELLSGEITGISGGHLEGEDPDQRHRARRADKISRKLFPLAFAVFNAGYWGFYAFWNFS